MSKKRSISKKFRKFSQNCGTQDTKQLPHVTLKRSSQEKAVIILKNVKM